MLLFPAAITSLVPCRVVKRLIVERAVINYTEQNQFKVDSGSRKVARVR